MFRLLLILLLVVGCEEDTQTNEDTEAPTVVITSPINATTLDALTIVRIDAVDNEEVERVALLVDGELYAEDSDSPYEIDWDVCAYEDGEYSLLAKAKDKSENIVFEIPRKVKSLLDQ